RGGARAGGSSRTPPPGTVRRRGGSCEGCRRVVSVQKTTPRERAAPSKWRGEKSQPPTPAAARAELLAGRLPRAEWLSVRAAERAEGEAGEILAELLGRLMDQCSEADAARQSLPFALGRARDALLRIVRWRFPARDEGETGPEGDGAWREDEEPQPRDPDSWAQGSVPVLRVRPSPKQDTPAAAEAGGPPAPPLCPGQVPAASAVLPVPGPSRPELLLDEADIPPGPRDRKPPRARPPLPRPAPLCLVRPPAPCPPPGPAEPPGQPEEGRRPPRSSHGDVEGSGAAGVSSHRPPLPPPSCTSLVKIRPGMPPRGTGAKREGSGTVLGVPRLGPGSRPERWIRPQVEVLDPGAEAKPPACPQGARWRSRGPELGSSRLPGGLVTVAGGQLQPPPPGSPQPPSPVPWQLGSLLDSARLAPGVTIRRGGSVKHGLCIPAHGEEEEEEEEEEETMGEAKRDLRPIRPDVPFPAIAAR
ncbi:hypothetical protein FQV23_0013440, partial [Spheniscus humboldti]